MIRELLDEQRRSLDRYFSTLDCKKAEEIIHRLLHSKGNLLFSGVGKSGHIAQKIASSFLSMGTKAFFLDPTQALHGDLGMVSPQDLFFAFSKSGESQELLALIPFIHQRGATTIAIVSNERARLALACREFIVLPVERELCPFDLAPTTSTAIQLLFGDALAIALMRAKKISLDTYALNHPGGLIGRRISLRVADLMLRGEALPLCNREDLLIEQLHELSLKRCGCLLVTDENKQLQGIFTDGDLRRSLELKKASALEMTLGELMTPCPRAISPQDLAIEAMRQMEEQPSRLITVLPVLEDNRVVGLLRLHDILQAGF